MQTLRYTLCIAVTKKERKQILAPAEGCGLSVSEFLYHVLNATDEFGKRYPEEAQSAAPAHIENPASGSVKDIASGSVKDIVSRALLVCTYMDSDVSLNTTLKHRGAQSRVHLC